MILAKSIDLLDAEGFGTFSLRRVASELQVHVTSLYKYFPTKEDLLTAIYRAICTDLEHETDPSAGWRRHLSTSMRSFCQMLVRHPYLMALKPYSALDIGLLHVEKELAALAADGFTPEESAMAFNLIRTLVVGAAMTEIHSAARSDIRYGLGPSDTNRYPNTAAATVFLRENWDDVFELGLTSLLDTIEKNHEMSTQAAKSR